MGKRKCAFIERCSKILGTRNDVVRDVYEYDELQSQYDKEYTRKFSVTSPTDRYSSQTVRYVVGFKTPKSTGNPIIIPPVDYNFSMDGMYNFQLEHKIDIQSTHKVSINGMDYYRVTVPTASIADDVAPMMMGGIAEPLGDGEEGGAGGYVMGEPITAPKSSETKTVWTCGLLPVPDMDGGIFIPEGSMACLFDSDKQESSCWYAYQTTDKRIGNLAFIFDPVVFYPSRELDGMLYDDSRNVYFDRDYVREGEEVEVDAIVRERLAPNFPADPYETKRFTFRTFDTPPMYYGYVSKEILQTGGMTDCLTSAENLYIPTVGRDVVGLNQHLPQLSATVYDTAQVRLFPDVDCPEMTTVSNTSTLTVKGVSQDNPSFLSVSCNVSVGNRSFRMDGFANGSAFSRNGGSIELHDGYLYESDTVEQSRTSGYVIGDFNEYRYKEPIDDSTYESGSSLGRDFMDNYLVMVNGTALNNRDFLLYDFYKNSGKTGFGMVEDNEYHWIKSSAVSRFDVNLDNVVQDIFVIKKSKTTSFMYPCYYTSNEDSSDTQYVVVGYRKVNIGDEDGVWVYIDNNQNDKKHGMYYLKGTSTVCVTVPKSSTKQIQFYSAGNGFPATLYSYPQPIGSGYVVKNGITGNVISTVKSLYNRQTITVTASREINIDGSMWYEVTLDGDKLWINENDFPNQVIN